MKVGRPKGVKDTIRRKMRVPFKSLALVGQRFHRLSILEFVHMGHGRNNYFKALCDCGKEIIVQYGSLTKNKTKSCGCLHREEISLRQIKPDNYAAKHKVFAGYRSGAKTRGYSFNLSTDEFFALILQNCYYCEKPPLMLKKTKGGEILHNGVDRVDNSIGYELNNCVPCCEDCNHAKKDVSKLIVFKAYEFLTKKS